MTDAVILSHFQKKQAWMASHIGNALYPTPESKEGLSLYQNNEHLPFCIEKNTIAEEGTRKHDHDALSFYRVDCHPLLVRYAKTLAQKWPSSKQVLILEYLSQVSLRDLPIPENTEINLWVAVLEGLPVATGMLFTTTEAHGRVAGIYDIFGIKDEQICSIKRHLLLQTNASLILIE